MKFLVVFLTILFAIAKILGYLTWSWWLIFLPVIVYVGVVLLIFIVTIIIALIVSL